MLSFTSLGNDRFPEKQNRLVNNYTSVLKDSQEAQLERKLRDYADSSSTQICVVIIETTSGEDPNLYAAELGEEWGVGQKGFDNGMVILVAVEDRNIAIQNGYGLEPYLTDLRSQQIIDQYILPRFKEGNYYAGLDQGTNQVFKLLNGTFEGKPARPSKKKKRSSRFIFLIIIAIIILSRIFKGRGGRGGGIGRGAAYGGYWMGGLGGHSHSSGGFGGGGGFGGFGGGSFGGGGASGSW